MGNQPPGQVVSSIPEQKVKKTLQTWIPHLKTSPQVVQQGQNKIFINYKEKEQIFSITFQQTDTISTLKNKIYKIKTNLLHHQLILYNQWRQLDDDETIYKLRIKNCTTFRLVTRRILTDIGVFDVQPQTISTRLLLEEVTEPHPQQINKLITSESGNPHASFQYYQNLNEKIEKQAIDRIIQFIDAKYSKLAQYTPLDQIADLRINISRWKLAQISSIQLIYQLERLFNDNHNEIIIRRCQAHNKMIKFHTDYSQKTLQLSLNNDSEYSGGRLIFASGGKLHIPKRRKGTITIHNKQIVHGVTELKQGIRYGLFLLKN